MPTITQGVLYQNNRDTILALIKQIDIANVNNLEFVTDFNFSNDQILNYGQQKGIVM